MTLFKKDKNASNDLLFLMFHNFFKYYNIFNIIIIYYSLYIST